MRKTEESAAGAQDLQQVVQFPHSYHLLLQVHLCVQVVTLKMTCINHASIHLNLQKKSLKIITNKNVFPTK